MKNLAQFFFRGLLLVAPVGITIYVLYAAISWMDNLIEVNIPGLGLIIILGFITVIGYFTSTIIIRPFVEVFESILLKIPVVGIIYSSLKDFTEAFVGDKRKFTEPVIAKISDDSGIHRLGFIAQEDLHQLGVEKLIAIYIPHSYNFSGNLYLLPPDNVRRLEISSARVMKFIVSGGVSGINQEDIDEIDESMQGKK